MPKLRYQSPDRLIGATEFSKHDELRGSLNTIRLVKSQSWVWDELREACKLGNGYARKREPGHWELAAVAFVASKQVHIQGWYDETTEELWRECGFAGKPPYMRVWRRLRELETVCENFLAAAGKVIQRCREHDERVMAHVHIDSTEDETHAALIHDCQAGEDCAYQERFGRRPPGYAKRPERVGTAVARKHREELNTEAPIEDEHDERLNAPERVQYVRRGSRIIKRIRQEGCWYRTRDMDAGIRAYKGERGAKRFWHGYYSSKAIDHFTGGVIPGVDNASVQECNLFAPLYDRVCEMSGATPETVIGDKGFSISSCFEHATKNGTAPIFPWRPRAIREGRRQDQLAYDRHGVKRCKYCGGPMEQVRFSAANQKPRLWFRCMVGGTTECAGEQTISCAEDWRTLIPLPRTSALYHELKESHQTYEGVHDYWRDRYKVAADVSGIRPRVVSLDWHRLRANVACLIDWLRIAAKNDWMGSAANTARHTGERSFKATGERIAVKLGRMRQRMGLAQPYGPKAAQLGLGLATPPSQRPRGTPRNQLALDLPGP
jgi:hypothetical protein